ncbi:MAG: 30S ribosomal protein S15 [Thermoplasmataceae archaeon]
MARMHTRKRGKSGSNRVYGQGRPAWLSVSDEEISKSILDLNKQGLSNSLIGIRLRDQYGVPGSKPILGKKIGSVLRENGIKPDLPEDLSHLINRYKNVRKHTESNRKDMSNIRGEMLIMSKMLRLVRYYKRKGSIAPEWNLSKVL